MIILLICVLLYTVVYIMYVMGFIMLYIIIFTYDIRRVEISITKTRRAYMLYTVVNIVSYIYI